MTLSSCSHTESLFQFPPRIGTARDKGGSDSKESACNAGDLGLIPGLGRTPGGGHSNPFQYSCLYSRIQESLEKFFRGTWQATVHGVLKSRTRLSTAQHRDKGKIRTVEMGDGTQEEGQKASGGPSVWETNEESRVTLVFKTRLGMARGMRREGVERNHEVQSQTSRISITSLQPGGAADHAV